MAEAAEETPEGEGPEAQPSWGQAGLQALAWIFAWPLAFIAEVGFMARLMYETFMWGIRPPYRFRLIIEHLEFLGAWSRARTDRSDRR